MPSLIEKMQPWTTQTHSFIPTNFLRRSWSSSASSAPLKSSSTTSLLSLGGSSACSATSASDSGSSIVGKNVSGTVSSNNGSRPKRKTPILSTCMSNWVKFDHDCKKPLPCTECESNQERNRKVLFTSGGNMLISSTGKGRNHHHRHSSHIFSNQRNSNNHQILPGGSVSEPTTPTDIGNGSSGGSNSSHNNSAFSGEVVSWENAKNKSSFKIVINVPCLDLNLFENENIQVEIVCNKNKLATGKDFAIVQRSRTELRSSGWYWEGIDSQASMEILESAPLGAFIIRDSSDPRYLYSLSVQTERGPTSVRLIYRSGKFSLDADEKLAEMLPKFNSVIRLIEHYVNGGTKVGKQVWIDPKGNMHSTVKLTKPVQREVGSLKHLSRVAINQHSLLTNTEKICSSSANSSPSTHQPNTTTTTSVNNHNSNNIINISQNKKSPPVVPNNGSCSSSKNIEAITTPSASTSTITTSITDLSKLPMSLQNYMLDYPYNL